MKPLFRSRSALASLAALLAAGCSGAAPRESLEIPMSGETRSRGDEIVALLHGEPLTWRAVAEKTLELDLAGAVRNYLRWKIVEDRKTALGIAPSPAELDRRAGVYLEQLKKDRGDEAVRAHLGREGATEEAYRDHLAGTPFLAQILTLDLIVRYAEIGQGRPYAAAQAEIFESVLKNPPGPDEYSRWIDAEIGRYRIELGDRGLRQNGP